MIRRMPQGAVKWCHITASLRSSFVRDKASEIEYCLDTLAASLAGFVQSLRANRRGREVLLPFHLPGVRPHLTRSLNASKPGELLDNPLDWIHGGKTKYTEYLK